MSRYLVVVYVPPANAEAIRRVLADAGAGKLGNYDSCSFSTKGTGRFRPLKGAKPTIGKVGAMEEVEEERIEAMLEASTEDDLHRVIVALRKAHPYEEPAMHVLPMIEV